MKASTFVFDIQDEIKLYLRIPLLLPLLLSLSSSSFCSSLMVRGILAKMRECVVRFNREAKEYARQHNLFVQISADTLL